MGWLLCYTTAITICGEGMAKEMTWVAILAAAGLGALVLWFLKPRGNGDEAIHKERIGARLHRLQDSMDQYAVMTEALMAETPDEALLEAVLSNLWAKMQPDLSDAQRVMAGQTPERQAVYAVYAVTGGAKQEGLAAVRQGADGEDIPLCADALAAIGAEETAAVLREAAGAEDPDAYTAAYLEHFDAEDCKGRLVAYIRAHARAFWDA